MILELAKKADKKPPPSSIQNHEDNVITPPQPNGQAEDNVVIEQKITTEDDNSRDNINVILEQKTTTSWS